MFRKLYHLGGLIFPALLFLFSKKVALYTCAVFFVIILLFDMFRLQWKELNLLIIKKFPIRFKKKEVKNLSGSPYFLGGCLLTLLFFSSPYAIGGIVFLSIGDMSAVLIGKNFGRIRIYGKTLEGAVAFAVSTAVALLLLRNYQIIDLNISGIIISSIICAIIELLPLKIDDNLIIPIVGASLLKIFG